MRILCILFLRTERNKNLLLFYCNNTYFTLILNYPFNGQDDQYNSLTLNLQ